MAVASAAAATVARDDGVGLCGIVICWFALDGADVCGADVIVATSLT